MQIRFLCSVAIFLTSVLPCFGGETFDEREWIVFSSNLKQKQHDLFAIRPDGTNLRRLTDTPASAESNPCWYGGRIAFLHGPDFNKERFEVHSILPDGTDRKILYRAVVKGVRRPINTFSLSPDGKTLAYTFKPENPNYSSQPSQTYRAGLSSAPAAPTRTPEKDTSIQSSTVYALAIVNLETKTETIIRRPFRGVPNFTPDSRFIVLALREDTAIGVEHGTVQNQTRFFYHHMYQPVAIDLQEKDLRVQVLPTESPVQEEVWTSLVLTPRGDLLLVPTLSADMIREGFGEVWLDPVTLKNTGLPLANPNSNPVPMALPHIFLKRWTGGGWEKKEKKILDASVWIGNQAPHLGYDGSGRPNLSPDSRYLLYQQGNTLNSDYNIFRYEIATGKVKTLTGAPRQRDNFNLHAPQWCRVQEAFPLPSAQDDSALALDDCFEPIPEEDPAPAE